MNPDANLGVERVGDPDRVRRIHVLYDLGDRAPLDLLKRQMYGRAGFALLRQRILLS
jgi:hypothetical protein